MNAYLFFDGDELDQIPAGCPWDQMPAATDTIRMAWICADSWRRAGWTVTRLKTHGCRPDGECRVTFGGRLRRSLWYPRARWQQWEALHEVTDREGAALVFTIDAFNAGLSPAFLNAALAALETTPHLAVSLQDHWTCSAFVAYPGFAIQVAALLREYDAGRVAEIPGDWVSDETIIRVHSKRWAALPFMQYANDARAARALLVHYPRSAVQFFTQPSAYP